MDNKLTIGCLEGMVDIMARRWEGELDDDKDTQFAQVYAQLCTALAAINAPKQFIQIGRNIFNRSDITRVAIEKGYRNNYQVCIYTKEIQPGPEGEGMSYSFYRSYPLESEEGNALLAWLEPQIEVLVSYREDPPVAEGEEDI